MSSKHFFKEWEQNQFPEFKTLHFKAAKLQKAIHSLDESEPGKKELIFDFYEWFTPLDEQLCALLDGAMPDMLAGYQPAFRLVYNVIFDLPINQEHYHRLLRQFNKVLESPLI
jgi:hypothetical protein